MSSKTISSKELLDLLKDNKVDVQEEDLNRLLRMFGEKDSFTISKLLSQINKLDNEQFSDYTLQEALAFAKMFRVPYGYNYKYS